MTARAERIGTALVAVRRHRRGVAAAALAVLAGTVLAWFLSPHHYTARASIAWTGGGAGVAADCAGLAARERPALAAAIVNELGLAGVRPARSRDAAIAMLLEDLRLAATAPGAVAVSFTARSPAVASAVANRVADRIAACPAAGEAAAGRRPASSPAVAVDTARTALARAQGVAEGFRRATDLLGGSADGERGPAQTAPPGRPRAAEGVANAGVGGAPAALQDLRAQAAELRELRAQLQQRFGGRIGPEHPAMLDVQARIAQVDRRIAAETGRRTSSAAAGMTQREGVAERHRTTLRARLEQARLDQAARWAVARYAALLALPQPAPVPAFSAARAFVTQAAVPGSPDPPRPWVFAAAGAILAALAGAAVAVGLERSAPGIRQVSGAGRLLGMPVLGILPKMAPQRSAGAKEAQPADPVGAATEAAFADAVARLRGCLRIGAGPERPRSIAISSAMPGEGKTTVAIALARSAARAGLRTLLIDCDVRRPAASRALAPDAAIGLAEVLRGEAALEQAAVRDAASGAWVLAASPAQGMELGLVSSPAMATLLDAAMRYHDLVLLDTAPALALAETAVVARLADAVLLIARWRRTPVAATRTARNILARGGGKVAGVALTRVDAGTR